MYFQFNFIDKPVKIKEIVFWTSRIALTNAIYRIGFVQETTDFYASKTNVNNKSNQVK